MDLSDIEIRRAKINSSVVDELIAALNAELKRQYPEEGATHFRLDPDEVAEGRGAFLVGYAIARSICELFREPDVFLGYFAGGVTMGQLLCIPMLAVGAWLMLRTR